MWKAFKIGAGKLIAWNEIIFCSQEATCHSEEKLKMKWLSKLQIQGFFSRVSAKRKQSDGKETSSHGDEPDDNEELAEEYASLTDEEMLEKASVAIQSEIGVKSLVIYDVYNLCEMAFENRLSFFKVKMLREMCKHFEIPSNS
ncbi:unnamed protein product, partial [Pocillopora meandrina]